jgi:hypothetical protein
MIFTDALQDFVFGYEAEELEKVDGLALILGTMIGIASNGSAEDCQQISEEAFSRAAGRATEICSIVTSDPV